MSINQKLRGLVGQAMDGRKAQFDVYTAHYPPGNWTFTAPQSGWYKFVAWGGGGGGGVSGGLGDTYGGASGAYAEITVRLGGGDAASISVAAGGAIRGIGGTTTLTFANGRVVVCTGGAAGYSAGSGGAATGGDVNLAGSANSNGTSLAGLGTAGGSGGSGAAGGAGAPANSPFQGARGGDASSGAGPGPGAGGGLNSNGCSGGPGLVIIQRVEGPYTGR